MGNRYSDLTLSIGIYRLQKGSKNELLSSNVSVYQYYPIFCNLRHFGPHISKLFAGTDDDVFIKIKGDLLGERVEMSSKSNSSLAY